MSNTKEKLFMSIDTVRDCERQLSRRIDSVGGEVRSSLLAILETCEIRRRNLEHQLGRLIIAEQDIDADIDARMGTL